MLNQYYNYGLDLKAYAHATTPLRNYSSLFNQRMVTAYMIEDKLDGDLSLKLLSNDLAKYLNNRLILNKIYTQEVTNKRKALTK